MSSREEKTSTTNYYEILEVASDAAPHEIHKAYQRAKNTYGADNPALYSMFNEAEARELLRLIEEAYSVLSNPGSRRAYDEARARGESLSKTASKEASTAEAHRSLPDFAAPEYSTPAEATTPSVTPTTTSKAPPSGMGRTSLSTYKIDETFENELRNATEFDGGLLQRIRLYKNVSIDRMSEATRISRTYLMSVETNDFKSLPAAVYVRGFIVQIARVLGLDDQKVASSYIKIFRASGGK